MNASSSSLFQTHPGSASGPKSLPYCAVRCRLHAHVVGHVLQRGSNLDDIRWGLRWSFAYWCTCAFLSSCFLADQYHAAGYPRTRGESPQGGVLWGVIGHSNTYPITQELPPIPMFRFFFISSIMHPSSHPFFFSTAHLRIYFVFTTKS